MRIAPRHFDDDNLIASLKHVRDGVARAFGVDDRNPYIEFWYEQRKNARPRQEDVHIEIRLRAVPKETA